MFSKLDMDVWKEYFVGTVYVYVSSSCLKNSNLLPTGTILPWEALELWSQKILRLGYYRKSQIISPRSGHLARAHMEKFSR
jgi:hypothetical protein